MAEPDSVLQPVTRRVTFESFERHDTVGVVRLYVRAGENVHREDYSVRVATPGPGWGIIDVRIWGAMRVYFVNP